VRQFHNATQIAHIERAGQAFQKWRRKESPTKEEKASAEIVATGMMDALSEFGNRFSTVVEELDKWRDSL
jgi:hypothetical protein